MDFRNVGPMPTRPVVMMDAAKVGYFAKAAMVRAGTMGTYGALSGLTGLADGQPNPASVGVCDDLGRCCNGNGAIVPCTLEPGDNTAVGTPANQTSPNGSDTVAGFFDKLGRVLMGPNQGQSPSFVVQKQAGFPVTPIVIGAVVVGGGLLLMKVLKKK